MSHVAHDIKSRSIRCPNWNADCKVRTKFRPYFPRPPGARGGGVDQANHRSRGTSGRQRTAHSAYDGAYQNVRKKSPRCVVPGGLLRNPSRRNKSGKILETWFGKPSDSQAARSMLSSPDAKMKKKTSAGCITTYGLASTRQWEEHGESWRTNSPSLNSVALLNCQHSSLRR